MPVYLLTVHAYRSWREDNPRGYVQREEGLKETNIRLARWRAANARQTPALFSTGVQKIIGQVASEIAVERGLRLHAQSATATHVHVLISFVSPVCTCGPARFCGKGCEARKCAEGFARRMKQKMGQAAAKSDGSRQWFSRGWDLTRVRDREHFDRLVGKYLPRHAGREGGVVHVYK